MALIALGIAIFVLFYLLKNNDFSPSELRARAKKLLAFRSGSSSHGRNFKKILEEAKAVSDATREELLAYIEKNNHSKKAYLGAFAVASSYYSKEVDYLYTALKHHPHDVDLWNTLLLNDADEERLFKFITDNSPPSPENSYFTTLWLINYYSKKQSLTSLLPEFRKLLDTKQNSPRTELLTAQSAYQLYQDLGYKESLAKAKAFHSLANTKIFLTNFYLELSRNLNHDITDLSQSSDYMADQQFQELLYYSFLMRNSLLKSYNDYGSQYLELNVEYFLLKRLDPSMEYGDTGMTIGERQQQLKELIEINRSANHIMSEFDYDQMTEDETYLFLDINLTYQGRERDDKAIELIHKIEKRLGYMPKRNPSENIDF